MARAPDTALDEEQRGARLIPGAFERQRGDHVGHGAHDVLGHLTGLLRVGGDPVVEHLDAVAACPWGSSSRTGSQTTLTLDDPLDTGTDIRQLGELVV